MYDFSISPSEVRSAVDEDLLLSLIDHKVTDESLNTAIKMAMGGQISEDFFHSLYRLLEDIAHIAMTVQQHPSQSQEQTDGR